MATKDIKSRIILKHDTEVNWNKATNFIPNKGELIIYDIDNNYDHFRIKIGDGVNIVKNLSFIDDHISQVPEANASDVDKFLRVNSAGQAYWSTVQNAEEVLF